MFPGNRPRDSTFFGLFPCDFCFKELLTLTDVSGETCRQQGLQGCGETWGGGSLALGPSSMGLRLRSSEKEIQVKLQDEVRLPLSSQDPWVGCLSLTSSLNRG